MSDLLKSNGEGTENVINLNTLRAQSHAFLAGNSTPASPDQPSTSQPATTADVPSTSPVMRQSPLQSQVTVTEQPAPGQPAPVAAQQPPAAPAATAEPQIINLPDDALVEVIVDGVKSVRKWGEARADAMRASKFTKEMQKLRAEESQVAQLRERAAQAEKLEQLLTNPDKFLRYAQANPVLAQRLAAQFGTTVAQATAGATPAPFSAPVAAPAAVPNAAEIVDFGQLNQKAAELEARLAQSFGQNLETRATDIVSKVKEEIAASIQAFEDAKQISHINVQINDTINGILTANPVLKAIPNVQQLLRNEVMALQPRTQDEMFEAFDVAAKGIVEEIESNYNQARAMALIAKQELVDAGVQPPKGQAPNTTIVNQTPNLMNPRTGKFDFKALSRVGRDYLNQR